MYVREYKLNNSLDTLTTKESSELSIYDEGKSNTGIQVTKANQTFLSNVSHNIKNPFGALLGYSELILEDYSELSDSERLLYLSEISKTANRTFTHLERFLEWIYYKTEKYKTNFIEENLYELILRSLKNTLKENKFTGELSLNIDKKIEVFVDSETTIKMFTYLFENAMKYSLLAGKIYIKTKLDDNYVIIDIIDEGIGIPHDKIEKLFDISIDNSLNKKGLEGGCGLGLILSEEIIKINHGSIKITNNIKVGITVTVKLPIKSVNN